MTNLNISLKDDQYTDDQKKEMWSKIHKVNQCPECGAVLSFLQGPRCGLAFNIKCDACHVVFWTTPYIEFGSYPVSVNNPPKELRSLIDESKEQDS